MKKNIIISALLTASLLTYTGCSSAAPENNSESNSSETGAEQTTALKTVRIGSPGNDSYPLLESLKLALDKGFLEEELNAAGYTADFTAFQEAGPAINEAYASGALDIAVYGDLPASTAFSKGVDIKVFGVADNQMNVGVIASPDSGISTVKDLEGKKVIVGIGTNFHEYWQHLIEAYDLNADSVEIVNVVSDAASVFTTGEADAWLTLYYNNVYYSEQGVASIIENTVEHPEMAGLWLATGRTDFLESNPEAAKAILRAMKRSKEYTVEHPDEFFNAIASPTLGVEVFTKAYNYDPTFSFLDYDITSEVIDKLEYTSDFLASNGFIEKELDIDSFIDRSYIEGIQ